MLSSSVHSLLPLLVYPGLWGTNVMCLPFRFSRCLLDDSPALHVRVVGYVRNGVNQLEYIHCRMVQSCQRYSKIFDLENEVRPWKQSTLEDQSNSNKALEQVIQASRSSVAVGGNYIQLRLLFEHVQIGRASCRERVCLYV